MATRIVAPDEAKAHLAKQSTHHDDQIDRVCLAVNDYIERRCGRRFSISAEETREACVDSIWRVNVVDLLSLTEIRADTAGDYSFSQVVDPAAVRLMPRSEDDGTPAVRFQYLVPVPSHADSSYLIPGRAVEIDGDWGYVEGDDNLVPEGVVSAGLLLVARYYKRREAPLNVTTMPASGFKRLFDGDKDAQELLAAFVHPRKRRLLQ